MSKNLGNVTALNRLSGKRADILRLWVSSADFKSDVRGIHDILKQLTEVYAKFASNPLYVATAMTT